MYLNCIYNIVYIICAGMYNILNLKYTMDYYSAQREEIYFKAILYHLSKIILWAHTAILHQIARHKFCLKGTAANLNAV